MAKGIDQTATDAMAAAKVRQQQAALVDRIVKLYDGKGLPMAKIIQLKAVLMGISTSGGNLAPLEKGASVDHWNIDQLLAASEQQRKTLKPAIPKSTAPVAPRPKEPEIVPCHRCHKMITVGDTACVFCRIPLVWRGNQNFPPI